MKPCYTIEELAHTLNKPFYIVAYELIACGVPLSCEGNTADLSLWKGLGAKPTGIEASSLKSTLSIIANKNQPVPDPSSVRVNAEDLTQSWREVICGEEKKKGFSTTDKVDQPVFDKESSVYPPELDIALQVWREVSATDGKGKPKARIKGWLNSNTKLSAEAKERIAIVVNWSKTGGATRID